MGWLINQAPHLEKTWIKGPVPYEKASVALRAEQAATQGGCLRAACRWRRTPGDRRPLRHTPISSKESAA
jgi:hypothetical protein